MKQKQYLTLSEASELTGLTKNALRKRVKRGTLPVARNDEGTIFVDFYSLVDQGLVEGSEVSFDLLISEAKAILADENDRGRETELARELIDERAKVKELKAIVRQMNQRETANDRIVNSIQEAIQSYPYAQTLRPTTQKRGSSKDNDHEMVLVISDAHYPEVVNPEEALGISYGPDIVRKRMNYLLDRTLRLKELHENNFGIGKITVAVLGDMLSGNIHEELEITNAMPMGEALTDMTYMLYDIALELSKTTEVEVVVMPGNHPRMTKKPRNKQRYDNFEFIMGQFLKGLARDNFTVTVPKDIIYAHKVFDWRIGMTHGDGSKAASFAGIPFYGIKQRVNATQSMLSNLDLSRLDMLMMGHYHQMLSWTEGDCHIFINGAIKGGDEYSITTRSSASRAVQGLLTFHKKRGWINTERIELEHII
jgi:predicted phosphodiesterase/DNA-binding transcriptional MerR regulator